MLPFSDVVRRRNHQKSNRATQGTENRRQFNGMRKRDLNFLTFFTPFHFLPTENL